MMSSRFGANERRHNRVALKATVAYRYGSRESGVGRWNDVSESGGSLTIGRYLRPGTNLMMATVFRRGALTRDDSELKAQVVWCCKEQESNNFTVGIRIFLDEDSAKQTIEALLDGALDRFWNEPQKTVHWRPVRRTAAPTPYLTQRLAHR